MPAIYLSHGAPPLADDEIWPGQLADWARQLPKPKSVLMVSAHWEAAPLALGATSTVPLVYDFWGFPDKYYTVRYPAPGAPELADDVRKLLRTAGTPVADIPDRGLDHGGVRAAGRDVPGRGCAGAPGVHADPRPGRDCTTSAASWRHCATRAC